MLVTLDERPHLRFYAMSIEVRNRASSISTRLSFIGVTWQGGVGQHIDDDSAYVALLVHSGSGQIPQAGHFLRGAGILPKCSTETDRWMSGWSVLCPTSYGLQTYLAAWDQLTGLSESQRACTPTVWCATNVPSIGPALWVRMRSDELCWMVSSELITTH